LLLLTLLCAKIRSLAVIQNVLPVGAVGWVPPVQTKRNEIMNQIRLIWSTKTQIRSTWTASILRVQPSTANAECVFAIAIQYVWMSVCQSHAGNDLIYRYERCSWR